MTITSTVQITQLNGEVSTTQLRFESIEAATVDSVKTQLGIPIRKKKDKDGAESIDSLGTSNNSVNVNSSIDDETTKLIRLKIWNPSVEKYLLFKDIDLVNLQYDKNGGEMTKFKFVKKKSKKSKEGKEAKDGKEGKKKHKRTQSRDESKKDKSKDGTPKKDKESKDTKEKEGKDPKKSSSWKPPMFGINLSEVIEKQQSFLHNKSLVPLILYEISTYIRQKGGLKEEGLFRVSGSAQQVDDLRKLYDKKGSVDLNTHAPSIHSVASLLKQFFRELPEPLFPRRYYSTLIKVAKNPNAVSKVSNLKLIVTKLPRINRHSLIYLLKFLKEVANHADVNKMGPTNLGTVWGPNLIKEPPQEEPVNLSNFSQLMDSEHVNALICTMLDNLEGFEALKDDEDVAEVSTPIPPEHIPPPIVQGAPTLSMPAPQFGTPSGTPGGTPTSSLHSTPHGSNEDKKGVPAPNDQQMKIKKELLQNVALKKTIVTFEVGSTVRAKFDYAAQNVKMSNGDTDMSMKRGQEATVLENCPGGWIKVEMVVNDATVTGCVPCNYVTTATVPNLSATPASPLKSPLSPMDKRKSYIAPQDTKPAEQPTDFRSVLKKSERPTKPADAEPRPEGQLTLPTLKVTPRPHSNTVVAQPSGPRQLSKAHSFVIHGSPQQSQVTQPQSPSTKPPARPNSFMGSEPTPQPLQSALQPPAAVEKALAPIPSPQKQHSMSSLPTTDQLSSNSDWREATTTDGKKYYYNKRTRQTSWVVPDELLKAAQATLPPPIIVSPAPVPPAKPAELAVPASPAKTPVQPVESAPAVLSSTSDWKAAAAPNGKTYYYNVRTKETSWTKPMDEKAKEDSLTKSASTSSLGELQKKLEEEELELERAEGISPNLSPHNDNSSAKSDIESLEEEEERIRIEEQLLELEREEKMMMQQHESEDSEDSSEELSDEDDDDEEERRIDELRRKLEEEEARIQEEQRKIQERKAKLAEEEKKIREMAQRQKKKGSKTKADEELPELPPVEDS